jgi:hypothetical protein
MWLWILLLVAFMLYSVKEPYSGSPSDFVQEQAGEIDALHSKLQKVILTESYIDALQSDSNQTADQILQLKSNMPS